MSSVAVTVCMHSADRRIVIVAHISAVDYTKLNAEEYETKKENETDFRLAHISWSKSVWTVRCETYDADERRSIVDRIKSICSVHRRRVLMMPHPNLISTFMRRCWWLAATVRCRCMVSVWAERYVLWCWFIEPDEVVYYPFGRRCWVEFMPLGGPNIIIILPTYIS